MAQTPRRPGKAQADLVPRARPMSSLFKSASDTGLALSGVRRRTKPVTLRAPEPQPHPQGEYLAKCDHCPWRKRYKNPYQASLAALYHGEIWCAATHKVQEKGVLECFYCPESRDSFDQLAEHVQTAHFGRKRRNKPMAMRKPETSGGGDYNPWLTPTDIGKVGAKATITLQGTMREGMSQFGESMILDVKVKGKLYSWTVKFNSGNYPRLFKRFGSNERNWKGNVAVTVKEYMQKPYIAVE